MPPVKNARTATSQAVQQAVQLHRQGRFHQAEESYQAILTSQPNHFDAKHLFGVLRYQQGRNTEAFDHISAALKLQPNSAVALSNLGLVLTKLGRPAEALGSYDQALAIKPDYADALNNRGNALRDLQRPAEALASYDKALAIKPDYAEALNNRGNALLDLKRPAEALASYDKALAIQVDYADALNNRGNALRDLKRPEEALASYDKALVIKPDHEYAFAGVADCANKICNWARRNAVAGQVREHTATGVISPFVALNYLNDPALLRQCAENFVKNKVGNLPLPLWRGEAWRSDKIRIAYLSADFHRHATAYLMAELFERHDRTRFEIIGLSFGPDDRSEMRARLVAAFDQFLDVRAKSDAEVAQFLCELKVDIAVDLKGYTQDCRPRILAHRPAPIQVNYLGFPGTMGADFIDYIIADKVVLPFDQQPFYSERIVHLPDCYQPNDRRRQIAERTPARAEVGLPEQGFVFCSFNNNWKITPDVFDVWMRLLKAIDGSVLWLLRDNATAEQNLRKEAAARGVDPRRLVFAPRMKREDHLARYRLADLFLDTLPCNAHTTASDALWAGLPVVTCMGKAFAGRVAASLLNAIGLPELVTHDMADYEALALTLAGDPARLRDIKAKLAGNRDIAPLFDTDRFRCGIEAAYAKMWEIWQTGQKPTSFTASTPPSRRTNVGSSQALQQAVQRHQQGRFDEAEQSYQAILAAQPNHFDAKHLLGVLRYQQGRNTEALDHISAALKLQPNSAVALSNLGLVLTKLGRPEEALASYDQALAIKPDYAEAFKNRGDGLLQLKRLDEALASYDQAIVLKPDYAEAFNNRGIALKELERLDEALASYDQAIALRPDYAEAFKSRAHCRLLAGQYKDGWQDHEWRWDTKEFPSKRPNMNAPPWRGEEVRGRRLLVFAEQGLGDVIQFVRYLPLLVERQAKVTLLTTTKLFRLLRPLAMNMEVIGATKENDSYDFQCALMSLPLRFNTDLSSIPNKVPYLAAEEKLVARWKARIGEHGFKIGIAWQGNPNAPIDYRRSIPLAEFVALSSLPGVRLISLQKHHGLDQLGRLQPDCKIETLGDDFDSGPDAFVDTAAAMDSLDLIITSDTSIAHLGGALGRPTWLALKHVPDWRWMLDRDDSPWYPTMRLFRQPERDDWSSVFAAIERELRSLLVAQKGRVIMSDVQVNPTTQVSWGETRRQDHYSRDQGTAS